jgi:hypothetical protein
MRTLLLLAFFAPDKDAILDNLEKRALAALTRVQRAATQAEADQQRPRLRVRLEQSLGVARLPRQFQATVTSFVQRSGYGIEDLPAARLYIPDGLIEPAPAVLYYNNHNPDSQPFAMDMVRLGFVVLALQPAGKEHKHVELLAAGVSQQGLNQLEIRGALDYLTQRNDVDRKRIGFIGEGLTGIIAAATEDRISAAVLEGATDLGERIRSARVTDQDGGKDHCDIVPGLLQYANYHELLAAAAPKPALLIAPSAAQPIYEYGLDLYRSYGMPERIRLADTTDGGLRRKEAYAWFGKWLDQELNWNRIAQQEALSPERTPQVLAPPKITADRRTAILHEVMGQPPIGVPLTIAHNCGRSQRHTFEPERGIELPYILLRTGPDGCGAASGLIIAVADQGKDSMRSDPLVQEAYRRNWDVWIIDLRGIGELKPDKPAWVSAISMLLGEDFGWRQGWELSRVLAFWGGPRAIYARGPNASLAALYALSMPMGRNAEWAVVQQAPASFDSPAELQSIPFGVLRATDVRDLLEQAKPRIFLIDPVGSAPPPPPVRITTLDEILTADW